MFHSVASLACLTVLLASEAGAQTFFRTRVEKNSNVCLAWNQRNIRYQIDVQGLSLIPQDSEFEAIDTAFANWQVLADQCSDFKFVRGPRITEFKVGKVTGSAESNVVTFREKRCEVPLVPQNAPCRKDGSCGNTFKCWDHPKETLALTTTTFSTTKGTIVDADVEFNAADWYFTVADAPPCERNKQSLSCVATDIQNTMTHEIGHMVGFDHVNDENSTMAPEAPIGEIKKRSIDEGTGKGFCLVYPRGLPPASCEDMSSTRLQIVGTGVGTPGLQGLGCSSVSNSAGLLLLFSSLFWLVKKRVASHVVR